MKAGLEGALLTALANGRGMSLAALLMSAHVTDHQLLQAAPANVFINGLLDCDGSLEECVSEARKLVAQGFFAIKLKVSLSFLIGVL